MQSMTQETMKSINEKVDRVLVVLKAWPSMNEVTYDIVLIRLPVVLEKEER